MNKKKIEQEEEAGVIPKFRQIQLVGLNESIMLISNYEHENMDYLSKKCLRIYERVRTPKER